VTKKEEGITLECGSVPNVMDALLDIGGALCECSVITFLVPRCKLWLTVPAQVPCSNAANIGERKTWTQSEFCSWQNSNRAARASGNIYTRAGNGQTSCEVWMTSIERRRCSNEAKTRNQLKFARVPQITNRSQPLMDRSSAYCEDTWRRYCHLVNFCDCRYMR